MDKKIRVAQVIGKGNNGGVEAMIINLYRFIDREKVEFDFLIENECDIINKKIVNQLGGNLIIIPSYKNPFKYMKALKNIFEKGNYDIVHSNMNTLSVFTLRAAKKAGIKIRIAHSHSTSNKNEKIKNLIKNVLKVFSKKYATNYLACSELAGRWLFGDKAYENGDVTLINNGIDFNRFAFNNELREQTRNELGLKDEFLIGNVGRMMAQKNQMFFLKVLLKLKNNKCNVKALIVGDGPLKDELQEFINANKLNDDVIIISSTDKPEKFYNAFDCFLLPSLYEGLPVSGVEAQVNGLNCIFSDNISKEILLSKNALMLSIDSVDNWVDKIKQIKNSSVDNRINNVKEEFNIRYSSIKLLDYYQKVLDR